LKPAITESGTHPSPSIFFLKNVSLHKFSELTNNAKLAYLKINLEQKKRRREDAAK
jgi:hypothetical protein